MYYYYCRVRPEEMFKIISRYVCIANHRPASYVSTVQTRRLATAKRSCVSFCMTRNIGNGKMFSHVRLPNRATHFCNQLLHTHVQREMHDEIFHFEIFKNFIKILKYSRPLFEIFQKYFMKYFMKYFRAKKSRNFASLVTYAKVACRNASRGL